MSYLSAASSDEDCDAINELQKENKRLHAENEALRKANLDCVAWYEAVKAERDELLEAMKRIALTSSATVCNPAWICKYATYVVAKVQEGS